MKFSQFTSLSVLFAASLATLTPARSIQERSNTYCGQYDQVLSSNYTIYTDLWGKSAATSGSQCLTLVSDTAGKLAWSTNWTWVGGSSSVKSYSNVALTKTGIQVSKISSIPTVWNWSYTGTNIVADVAYDIFTSSTLTGNNEFEIMVWLAALGGAGPITSTGSPVATTTISGVTFKLYSGKNGSFTVYSFVATSSAMSFNGDLKLFLSYLVKNQGFSSSQYINTLEAGTEPFTGTKAVFTTSAYSVQIV